MKRFDFVRNLLLLFAILGLGSLAFADSHVRIVRLSYVDGKVQMDRADGQGLQDAFLNMPVNEGAQLVTGDDGKAEVQLEDGSTVRLVPNTTASFPQLALSDDGVRRTLVNLQYGTAYFNFKHKGSNDLGVRVGGQEVTLVDSSSFRIDAEPGAMRLAVLSGEVLVTGGPGPMNVKKQQTLSLDPNSGNYDLTASVSAAPYDAWNEDRNQYIDRYAYASSYQTYSPYYYGLGDLTYYGTFFNTAYGPVWRPYYIDASWSPFADGAWVYYPGFGYMWVSAYPWGWLPYHYGGWMFLPAYGWVWGPGGWNHFRPICNVAFAPAGFVRPVPPVFGPRGRGVILVGRGPSIGPHLRFEGGVRDESGLLRDRGFNGGREHAAPYVNPVQRGWEGRGPEVREQPRGPEVQRGGGGVVPSNPRVHESPGTHSTGPHTPPANPHSMGMMPGSGGEGVRTYSSGGRGFSAPAQSFHSSGGGSHSSGGGHSSGRPH